MQIKNVKKSQFACIVVSRFFGVVICWNNLSRLKGLKIALN